jgi:hypothetical protein
MLPKAADAVHEECLQFGKGWCDPNGNDWALAVLTLSSSTVPFARSQNAAVGSSTVFQEP